MLTVAAVDVDSEKDLGAEYKIQGFPTIKLLVSRGQGKPARAVEYKGGRTAAEIVSWAMQQAAKVADKRLGGGDGASGGPKQRASARASANAKAGQAPEEPGFYKGTGGRADALQEVALAGGWVGDNPVHGLGLCQLSFIAQGVRPSLDLTPRAHLLPC